MTQAIFLSYASQDADAARRICEALRAAGLEVWFDQNELTGGDAWDQKIRKQIKECALFVPLISANTQARPEGYFRLEWRLADQRTHLMAKGIPFILPVAIEGTSEASALVPDSFMDVQWTKSTDDASTTAFAARVAKLIEETGSPSNNAPTTTRGAPPEVVSANRGDAKAPAPIARNGLTGIQWFAIACVVLGSGAALWFGFAANKPASSDQKTNTITTKSAAPTAAPAINPLSVMVMPFANQTGDKDKAYIADALTSSITSDLSRIRDATIVPATTAFSLADKKLTIPQLGKEAAVRFVLTGAVTGDKERLRINAVLSDTETGAQLWAENFDGKQTDLFALQDQVTKRIGDSIGPQMVIVSARESEKRATTPQVSDLLMRASALWLNQQSLQNLQAMEALYRQALAIEPGNLSAKTGLALSLALQAGNFSILLKLDDAGRIAHLKKASDLSQEVKAIDPNNADIYLPILIYAVATNDFDTAIRAAKRRIELQPKSSGGYDSLGLLKMKIDDVAGAKAAFEKALEYASHAKPPAETYNHLANLAFREDKLDDAIAWAQKGIEANPGIPSGHFMKALAYARKGQTEQAKKAAAEAVRIQPGLRLANQNSFPTPWPGKEAAYRKFMDTQFIPAWRLAGLPG
jgi:TolB-like protein/tetratricopeptide (TPR) repeat protein